MIPWDTFKTPQDAYEWAKANAFRLRILEPWPWDRAWIVSDGFTARLCRLPTYHVVRR